MDLEKFDITAYLNHKGIPYIDSGKNVGQGWITVRCPFCNDPSNHLGISPEMNINCWRCPTTGTIIKLIMKLDDCGFTAAQKTINKFSGAQAYPQRKNNDIQPHRGYFTEISHPPLAKFTFTKRIKNYLHDRGLPAKTTFEKYGLGWFAPTTIYKYRLYIPIVFQRRLVAFTTRDMTDKSDLPYKHCPDEHCAVPIKQTLYNYDSAKDTAVVVEGAFDVYKVGDGCVATFGLKYTPIQVKLLKKFKRVFIMPDGEAEAQAKWQRFAHEVSDSTTDVEIIYLPSGDPGDLAIDDVKSLRREIFGKIY